VQDTGQCPRSLPYRNLNHGFPPIRPLHERGFILSQPIGMLAVVAVKSPEAIARKKAQRAARRQRLIDEYVAANGHPVCECGCGTVCGFDSSDRPYRFVRAHNFTDEARSRAAALTPGSVPVEECIEIEKFRAAVRKLKDEKGWTLADVGDRGGIGVDHMKVLMYAKARRHVSKEWAENFLRRVYGMGAPPTAYQQRDMEQSNKRHKSTKPGCV